MFTSKFDMTCTHERYCTKWCFERVYRQCQRLTEACSVVYEENRTDQERRPDKRKELVDNWKRLQDNIVCCYLASPSKWLLDLETVLGSTKRKCYRQAEWR